MLDRLIGMLRGTAEWSPEEGDGLQLAVAALLVEAAQMDSHFDQAERRTIERLLSSHFRLGPEETTRLMAQAEREAAQSTQLFGFAHTLVERLQPEERVRIVEMLWEVAYADGVLDPAEDTLIRRIAGLIYVSDRERGEARQRVQARRAASPWSQPE